MQIKEIKKRIIQIIQTSIALLSGKTSKYPNQVINFEKKISEFFGSKHCLTFSSGTAAARTILVAAGVRKNSKILMSKISFPSVISTALEIGADIEYLDFDENLQIKNISELTKPEADFLIITHSYGIPQNMINIMDFLKKNKNIQLIEDFSHAQGAKFDDKYIGTFGIASFMSMQGSKALSAGEGGVMITNDENIYEKSIVLSHINRKHSFKNKDLENFSKVGLLGKARAHPMGIILSELDLNELKKKNKATSKKFQVLFNKLKSNNQIKIPQMNFGDLGGFHYGFPFFCNNKTILEKLRSILPIIKYDWPCCDEFDEFKSSESFNNLLYSLKMNNQLSDYKDQRSYLNFVDLNWIQKKSLKEIDFILKKNDF